MSLNKKYNYISVIAIQELDNREREHIVIKLGYTKKKLQRCRRMNIDLKYVDCSERCLKSIKLPNLMNENEINEHVKANYDESIFEINTWKKELDSHKEKYWSFI